MSLLGYLFGAGTPAPPTPASRTPLVVVLVAIITSGIIQVAFNVWREHKRGPAEAEQTTATAVQLASEAAARMLAEYRTELDRAQKAITRLEERLGESNERIAKLEADLEHANGDRERLQRELKEAIEKRGAMAAQMEQLRQRVTELEATVEPRSRPG